MKKRIIYLVLVTLFTFGCENFLEEKSQSEIRPSTVKDMEKLLEGDAYPGEADGAVLNNLTDIFTDDTRCYERVRAYPYLDEFRETQRPRFAWEKGMFDLHVAGISDITFWTVCYSRIKGCNVILDYIDGKTGDEKKREHIRGEAYTLRGFYYLMLTNFFGMPYNSGDPTKSKAVPLKLTSGVTNDFDKLKKSSVAVCYTQIEKDLLEGARLMAENKGSRSTKLLRLNYLSAYTLLSRMYLYMEDYDNAFKYANLVLKDKPELLDLKLSDDNSVYGDTSPTEILWGVPESFPGSQADKRSFRFPYSLSDDFMRNYGVDINNECIDIRGDYLRLMWGVVTANCTYVKRGLEKVWIGNEMVAEVIWPAEILKGISPYYRITGGVRTAEAYLNRAEVYCRRYIQTGNSSDGEAALSDLNFLRLHRFTEGYVNRELSDYSTPEELLNFCLRERRRELCGEGNHRWFDLRRLGMPEIKHLYINQEGAKTEYILHEKSEQYHLPIPADVVKRNPSLAE